MQFGQHDLTIPLVNNDKALDPVYHLDLLMNRSKASLDHPAFSYRTASGSLNFLSHKMFTMKLKNLLSRSEKFSRHSLRRGGATFLYQCGATILQIQAGTTSALNLNVFSSSKGIWRLGILCVHKIFVRWLRREAPVPGTYEKRSPYALRLIFISSLLFRYPSLSAASSWVWAKLL